MKHPYSKNSKGVGILEVVIGVAVLSVSMMGLLYTYRLHLKAAFANIETIKAAFLLEEGVEAVRVMRDISWSSGISPLAASTTYYLAFDGSVWKSTTTPQYIDGYLRSFAVYNVYRDGNDDIATSGTLDSYTKKVTVFLAWPSGTATATEQLSTYLTNIHGS
jgi:Tfp pilus assembly protein PilV